MIKIRVHKQKHVYRLTDLHYQNSDLHSQKDYDNIKYDNYEQCQSTYL